MWVLLSSSLQGCFHIGQTLDEYKRVRRVFFDESLNRTKTEGGVKKRKYNALQPCPPSAPWKLQYYIIYAEDWRLWVYLVALIVVNRYIMP